VDARRHVVVEHMAVHLGKVDLAFAAVTENVQGRRI
jgi:hypothetical protein